MLNVGNNLLGSPLASFGAGPGSLASLAATAAAGESAAASALSDGVSPTAQPGSAAAASSTAVWGGAGNSAGGYIQQFMSVLFSAFTQLAQYVSSAFGQPPWSGSPTPQPSPTPGTNPSANPSLGPGPQPPIDPPSHGGQTFFASATASSSGDPHDTFDGTTSDGQTIDGGRWNNMDGHAFLLRSQSFDGGFHIATDETEPNANGVTRNSSATIDSDFGKHVVTMNRDGSYSIQDDGQDMKLAVGQTRNLGDGESVTLNEDNSLTVVEKNGRGGEITTTLRATGADGGNNGGGVNVKVQAEDVNLGGYLVRSARQSQSGSGGPTPAPGQPAEPFPGPVAGSPGGGGPVAPGYGTVPFQFQSAQPFEPDQSYQPFTAQQWSPEALAGA